MCCHNGYYEGSAEISKPDFVGTRNLIQEDNSIILTWVHPIEARVDYYEVRVDTQGRQRQQVQVRESRFVLHHVPNEVGVTAVSMCGARSQELLISGMYVT